MVFFKFLFLFFHGIAWGQDFYVVSHYPETAYITERLLPFSIVGGEVEKIQIQSVHLIKGDSCNFMIDPFYRKIFHIYCVKPTRVQVDVSILGGNQEVSKISMDEFQIRGKDEQAASSEKRNGGS